MKKLINELENETRAILYELNRLKKLTQEKRDYTENEKKIKIILYEKIIELINAIDSFRELLKRLQEIDGFELGHGEEVGEIVKSETEEGKG